MRVEDLSHARLQGRRSGFWREAEVEPDLERAGNDVAGPGPGMDVRNLEARGLEVLVPAIPLGRHERAQRARRIVDRVAATLGIRDVALLSDDAELAIERATPAVLDRVAEALARRGLADDAGIDGLAASSERLDDERGAVHRVALLVGRQEDRDRPATARAVGLACHTLGRGDHRRQRSFHVRGATAIETAVTLGRNERIARPLVYRARRHDIHVACQADDRPRRPMARPQVADRSAIDPLALEAGRRQSRRQQTQAAGIRRRDRPARDELPGQLQRAGLDVAHARSSSLMDVLARVWASTRFTMTAQDSEYLPSDEGRLPGTTTDPDGTLPYRISPVARS